MTEEIKNELVSAHLVQVPWWRTALKRLGTGRKARHQETLDRLAGQDVTDTIGEADVEAWLGMLEGEAKRRSGSRTASKPSRKP